MTRVTRAFGGMPFARASDSCGAPATSRSLCGNAGLSCVRILYFSSRECWPLNTGARLRDYHLALELARRASVTYLGLRNPQDPPAVLPPPEAFAAIIVSKDPGYTPGKLARGLIGPAPVNVLNCWTQRVL